MVFDARFLETTSQFVLDGLTARGPTVDVAVKAETAPDGEGSSLKLDIDAGPSATSDLIRLWPQFINPDVREWCAAKPAWRAASGIDESQLDRRRPRRDGA